MNDIQSNVIKGRINFIDNEVRVKKQELEDLKIREQELNNIINSFNDEIKKLQGGI